MKYWNKKKSKLKLKFKEITRKDLNYSLGEEGDMLERLKDKIGMSKQDLLKIIIES
jgi:hypothetical protein